MKNVIAFCCLVVLVIFVTGPAASASRVYNTRSEISPNKINVHFVAHTHDDVGWLKTVDQYYIGSNNSIAVANVQFILDTVMDKLEENPDRKFIYVEQAFFQRWWKEQGPKRRAFVHRLVQSGQLEFINGGWCMHDEATTLYIDMIDQTALGHRYILEQFGKRPRVAWQLDPFGHSAVQAYLLSAEAGFDGLFFSRADFNDKIKRLETRTMEFVWRGSKSLGASSEVFAGLMHHHYDPPEGFRFDIKSTDTPIQDDPRLFDYNVEERVDAFVAAALNQSASFRTKHIMWAMGEDFAYSNAHTWYSNMDKFIHYVNKDGRVNVLYSTPSIYVDAKHAAGESWPLKVDDFFPYADAAHSFWTGYFTSRPALKRYARTSSAYLMAARQMEVAVGRNRRGPNTDYLEESVAIVQHHDGTAGTERQHVADDYAKRLALGCAEAERVVSEALKKLTSSEEAIIERAAPAGGARSRALFEADEEGGNPTARQSGPAFQQCPLMNVSYCPPSETELEGEKTLVVVAYNPLGWARQEFLRVPVASNELKVTDGDGQPLMAQIVPIPHAVRRARSLYARAHLGTAAARDHGPLYTLVFEAKLPPLGFSTFFVAATRGGEGGGAVLSAEEGILPTGASGAVATSIGKMDLSFSAETGRLSSMRGPEMAAATAIDQTYLWYNASDGQDAGPEPSGAYIFRPNSSEAFPMWGAAQQVLTKVVRGPLVEEIHQTFSPSASHTVRMFKDASHAEVDFTVGPIPIDDNHGKEVITRMSTGLESGGTFFTDSNGRDYIKRVLNYRADWEYNVTEPVAGNYYPLNAGIYLTDGETEFSVLVDRAVGGASLRDGQVEVMLHRRLLWDDGKGVGEALNEEVCCGEPPVCEGLTVQGTYYVSLNKRGEGARWRRAQAQQIVSPVLLAFALQEEGGADTWVASHAATSSLFEGGYELPPNVALITLQELADGAVLLRLAHLYEAGEDPEYSALAVVDLLKLFGSRKVVKVLEMSLTANQVKAAMKPPLKWRVEGESGAASEAAVLRGKPVRKPHYKVELGPMEIRTFSVRLR